MKKILNFFKDCAVGSNNVCRACRDEVNALTNALGPWLIADPIVSKPTILFVGKVARSEGMGNEIADYLEDVTDFGFKSIHESTWAYWAYTREIICRTFGSLEVGLLRTSFTNIVKCNNETTPDTTAWSVKTRCISENRFIWKEIEFLRPRLVIFYTARYYDDFIDQFRPSHALEWRDHANENVAVGMKTMPWWDRSFFDSTGNEVLRFLRIGHPERKKRIDFVTLVSDWIGEHLKTI